MLDVTMLRKNLPEVVARLKTRNFDFPVDAFNELEERRKSVQKKTEELQARRNSLSKDIGMMKKNGEDASELLAQAAAIPGELKALEDELEEIREKLHDLMLRVPNLPSPTTPIGKDETENVEVRRWGTPRTFDFPVKDHVDVGAPLGLDFDTAAKLSGARLLSCAAKSLICIVRSLSSCSMCIRVSKAIPNAIRRTSLPLPQ